MDLFANTPKPNSARIAQLKSWVQQQLSLPDDAVVMVSELRCSEPGCPPLETVIAVLDGPGSKRQYKFHKGVGDVTRKDIAEMA